MCNDSSHTCDQVRQLLAEDPDNSEYVDMEKELNEVILACHCFYSVCFFPFICKFKNFFVGVYLGP